MNGLPKPFYLFDLSMDYFTLSWKYTNRYVNTMQSDEFHYGKYS